MRVAARAAKQPLRLRHFEHTHVVGLVLTSRPLPAEWGWSSARRWRRSTRAVLSHLPGYLLLFVRLFVGRPGGWEIGRRRVTRLQRPVVTIIILTQIQSPRRHATQLGAHSSSVELTLNNRRTLHASTKRLTLTHESIYSELESQHVFIRNSRVRYHFKTISRLVMTASLTRNSQFVAAAPNAPSSVGRMATTRPC